MLKIRRYLLYSLLLLSCAAADAQQPRYSVVIDELMADPSPVVGLPSVEWIELKNTGTVAVDLSGWRLADLAGQSGPMPAYLLQPGSFVVICGTGAQPVLSTYGAALAVTSFPSLDNEGETLSLRTAGGLVMHAVAYEASWYRNALKQQGGWSLEMIDPRAGCAGAVNWTACVSMAGGTPGVVNSGDGLIPGGSATSLLHAYASDEFTIVLVFDGSVDSSNASDPSRYALQGIIIDRAIPMEPLFSSVRLHLGGTLAGQSVRRLNIDGLVDCRGQPVAGNNGVRVGLATEPGHGDVVINEILFNPRPGCDDFLELFNTGTSVIDVSGLSIANRNVSGEIDDINAMMTEPFLLFPGDHLAVTLDPARLESFYTSADSSAVHRIGSLPSWPDDRGTAILLNRQGTILDEVRYQENWQFTLIDDPEGVSLERVDPLSFAGRDNWHSASTTAGYATPGALNSQSVAGSGVGAPGGSGVPGNSVIIDPPVFSPDNDGVSDLVRIHWQFDAPGYMGMVRIFNRRGNETRRLVNNQLLSAAGSWTWDGLDDRGKALPAGHYIVITEIFRIDGKTRRFRNLVVLGD